MPGVGGLFDAPGIVPAVTLRQPWAGLVALGLKTVEARGKATSYRGDLVICAGLRVDAAAVRRMRRELVPWRVSAEDFDQAVSMLGVALALVRVDGCAPLRRRDRARSLYWRRGLSGWQLGELRRLAPFRARGKPGFFPLPWRQVELAARAAA